MNKYVYKINIGGDIIHLDVDSEKGRGVRQLWLNRKENPDNCITGRSGKVIFAKDIISFDTVYLAEKKEDEKDDYLYYKVVWGFDEERTTYITNKLLDRAIYAMTAQAKVNLGDTMLDGKYIIAIKEDYHKHMGWNYSYELGPEDYAQIRDTGVQELYKGKLEEAKIRVKDWSEERKKLIKQEVKQLK
jgi:hypothetical protein